MASGWNSESDREAMLRRVAIVLSSLPGPVAAQLLGSIDPQTKQAVRRTMTSLADVDPLERRRALQAFKVSVQDQPQRAVAQTAATSPAAPVGDQLEIENPSSAAEPTSRVVPAVEAGQHAVQAFGGSPLSFLAEVQDETLVNLLAMEHPQAVALVLASVPPAQAARVLPQLDPNTQNESLRRIGRLGEIPEAAAAEVAQHFRNRLAQQNDQVNTTSGRRVLDAILAAMPQAAPTSAAPPTPAAPQPSYAPAPQSTTQLPSAESHPEQPHSAQGPVAGQSQVPDPILQRQPESTSDSADIRPVSFPTADLPAIDLSHKLRVAEQSWQDENVEDVEPVGSDVHPAAPLQVHHPEFDHEPVTEALAEAPTPQVNVNPSEQEPAFESTDSIHQHLIALPPKELCKALGKVDTRDAMLALCGLPNDVTEGALAHLPKAAAKKVRGKMNGLSSLHLREIDEAKERVARASLTTDADSHLPVAA